MPAHIAAWSANAKSSHLEGDMLAKTSCGEFGALEQYTNSGKQESFACAEEADMHLLCNYILIRGGRHLLEPSHRLKSIVVVHVK